MKIPRTPLYGLTIALLTSAALLPHAEAITITTDSFTDFDMDFAEVGDTTNVDDGLSGSTAYGAVSYEYRMGVNEVSEAMIDAYNANSGGPTITKDTRGADKPATSVSWNEAARFVNWLNTSQGHVAAYNFTTGGANDNISLWDSADAWQLGGENLYRHKDAYYFLPSEDEWYKAAFYDGNSVAYYDYATGQDIGDEPTAVAGGTAAGTAVYGSFGSFGPADIDDAGGLSYYGTMAQSGNVFEWGESAFDGGNDTNGESRVLRGGWWFLTSSLLQSSNRSTDAPVNESTNYGFRVASVELIEIPPIPEPSSTALLGLGGLALMLRRRR